MPVCDDRAHRDASGSLSERPRTTEAQAIATALRASLIGILYFVASWTPAKAVDLPPDQFLAKLDEAERLWKASQPKNYSYSMSIGYAFTGTSGP